MLVLPVKVYYNDDPDAMLRGYEHGDQLKLVFDDAADLLYVPTEGIDDVIASIREAAFQAFNGAMVPNDASTPLYRRMSLRYYDVQMRSMSVGDVVVIGEDAWGCAPCGWKEIALEARYR